LARGREKAEVEKGGTIEVWGDGTAIRSYTHVDDMVEAMQSAVHGPVNIGCPQYVSVAELVHTVAAVAGKEIRIKYGDGPVGVRSRNFDNARIFALGWRPVFFSGKESNVPYPWIEAQVQSAILRTS
jgi:nucleoside-diphosphate-sugar epimerase